MATQKEDKIVRGADLVTIGEQVKTKLSEKQDLLVAGTNIKTINGESILGPGNVDISDGEDGKSTYQLWLDEGNTGSVADFLEAERGPSGYTGTVGELEVRNDVKSIDATAALSALQGKLINDKLEGVIQNYTTGGYLKSDGTVQSHTDYMYTTDYIPVTAGDTIRYNYVTSNGNIYMVLYNESYERVGGMSANQAGGYRETTLASDSTTKYVRASFAISVKDNCSVLVNGKVAWSAADNSTPIFYSVHSGFSIAGGGSVYRSQRINNLIPGRKYRLFIKNPDWDRSSTGSGNSQLILMANIVSGETTTRIIEVTRGAGSVEGHYDLDISDNDYVNIGIRANIGETVYFTLEDITDSSKSDDNQVLGFQYSDSFEELFLGKHFVNADSLASGDVGSSSITRVSVESELQVPYPGAKLYFKLPPYIVVSILWGERQYQLNNTVKWFSNGQTWTFPERSLYFRLRFGKSEQLNPGSSGSAQRTLTVAEIADAVDAGEIKIWFQNPSIIDCNVENEKYLRNCMRKYSLTESSDMNKSYNYFPVFVHATDVHGDATRLNRLAKYADYIHADAILATGDMIAGDTRNRTTFVDDIDDMYDTPIYVCMGNHENYGTAVYDNGGTIGVNFVYRQYITLMKHTIDKSEVVAPVSIEYPTYYYADLESKKIRIIALNQYEAGRDYDRLLTIKMTSNQINWFIDTLASTPQDYGVIVMIHQLETSSEKDEQHGKFWEEAEQGAQLRLLGTPLAKIIDAFISGTSISGEYTQFIDGNAGETETVSYSADFTSLNSGVEFIAYLSGHSHKDKIGYVGGTDNMQLMLNSTCTQAGCGYTDTTAANGSDLPRIKGSVQDSFNVYVVDRQTKTIRIARIGSNMNGNFDKRDYMIIPYAD